MRAGPWNGWPPLDHGGRTTDPLEAQALQPAAQAVLGIDVEAHELPVQLRELGEDQALRVAWLSVATGPITWPRPHLRAMA